MPRSFFFTTFFFLVLLLGTADASRSWQQYYCEQQPHLVCYFSPIGKASNITGYATLKPHWRPGRWYRGGWSHGFWRWGRWRRGHCGTHIYAYVKGLKHARQGWHIHEYGDVSDYTKGKDTGGHYSNPWGLPTKPGLPGDRNRHWGELGNLVVNSRGVAVYNRIDRVVTQTSMIIGRALVIHAKEDYGRTPNAPGAGARVAQCVIGRAKVHM